ncbi:nucleoside hydrolase [Mycetocola spongiae]|uniref:nucleoside hydrolase n=1 Tax=Mycetocola spongiae TaxID=2859226 RepID=UPI001CF4D69A|nr:nucleoside hydrolase [Mycetocola spongiae]UCR88410.1 nucleoside hydrolase [Mycetocola spongiae]
MIKNVIIDCDPGVDDAIAIALAWADPNLNILAISAVSGNVSLADTGRNAKQIRDYLGADIPVWLGADAPLQRPAVHAPEFHGENGLANISLRPNGPARDSRDRDDAVAAIIETLAARPGEIDLVAVGPLTNIALAVQAEPRVAEWARSLTIMGGAAAGGNVTAAAEFNIYADPEAASVVFNAGWTVTMAGLDVTNHALGTLTRVGELLELGDFSDEFITPFLTFNGGPTNDPEEGPAMHDSCAVAALARPELFEATPARVDIELDGKFTLGMTVADFTSVTPNARVLTRVDADGLWEYLRSGLSNLAERR